MKVLISLSIIFSFLAGHAAYGEEKAMDWEKAAGLYAVLETSQGRIVCKLFEKEAPVTVQNFVELSEGNREWVDLKTGKRHKKRFYDGLTFHRAIPDFMIQGGDPLGTGVGGPGYRFKDEIVPGLNFDRPGLLAMANSGPNTNGSQFFITEVPTPWLNGHHTIFGEVIEGLDVVKKIARVPQNPQNNKPLKDVIIKKVIIKQVKAEEKVKEGAETMKKKILFIVAPKDFRDEEYFEPKKIFEGAGLLTTTASLTLGEIYGVMGGSVKPDLLVSQVNPQDFDAVVFIGGPGSPVLWDNTAAQDLAKHLMLKEKVVAAICLAPNILGRAGILKDRKVTSFPSIKEELVKDGANFTGKNVEEDGKLITASGPEAAKEFGYAVLKAVSK